MVRTRRRRRTSFHLLCAASTHTHHLATTPSSTPRLPHLPLPLQRVEELLVFGAYTGSGISLVVALLVLLLVLRNWRLATIAALHVGMIAASSIGTFVWMGWDLGFIEALCIIIVIGFSVDFVAHVSIAYSESTMPSSRERVAQAVGELGISILSGAVSTGAVAAFMSQVSPVPPPKAIALPCCPPLPVLIAATSARHRLQCLLIPFKRVGVFMLISIAFSALTSLAILPITLAMCGPSGSTGELRSLNALLRWGAEALAYVGSVLRRLLTRARRDRRPKQQSV